MSWRFSKDLDWMARAACVGWDVNAFFGGERGGRPSLRKLPCAACEVRSECLAHALASHEPLLGVWGGRPLQLNSKAACNAEPDDGSRPTQRHDSISSEGLG